MRYLIIYIKQPCHNLLETFSVRYSIEKFRDFSKLVRAATLGGTRMRGCFLFKQINSFTKLSKVFCGILKTHSDFLILNKFSI